MANPYLTSPRLWLPRYWRNGCPHDWESTNTPVTVGGLELKRRAQMPPLSRSGPRQAIAAPPAGSSATADISAYCSVVSPPAMCISPLVGPADVYVRPKTRRGEKSRLVQVTRKLPRPSVPTEGSDCFPAVAWLMRTSGPSGAPPGA